ncbi:MAG: PorP/SprF family type IX secretion system membrane protein [Saprospiraceae bacterium]|nr:PorP/SprF family type IX secretion system membrane protein [Saprospiraceae bacterium]
MSRVIYIIGILLLSVKVMAQDPVFSQFYAHPLELNPALAGNSGGSRIGMNYRNQYSSLSSNYVTYAISADHYISSLRSGFGISLMADEAGQGIYRTYNGELSYSYQVNFRNETKVRMGLQAGFISVSLDYDRFLFMDQIDPIHGPVSPGGIPYPTAEIPPDFKNRTLLDIGAGGVISNENFYVGIGIKHANRPDINFYSAESNTKKGLAMRFSAMGGVRIPIGHQQYGRKSDMAIVPNILIVKQSTLGQINIGALLEIRSLNFGLYYRHGFKNPDAAIATIGYNTGPFKIAYSYDATISSLGINSGGAHEISLSYIFYGDDGGKYHDCTKIFR